jgi:toxin FitB
MLMWLLDTNVISEVRRKQPNPQVLAWFAGHKTQDCFLSTITIGEIEQGIVRVPTTTQALALANWLEQVLANFAGRILSPDLAVARLWGKETGHAAKRGHPLPPVDLLIAATALHHQMTLVTRNTRDLQGLTIKLENPWDV